MLATLADYGISADAGVQHRWGKRLVRWYASLGDEPRVTDGSDITQYGGFCELVTQAVVATSPLEPYTSRHLANLLFAFAAFLAVVAIGRRLGGAAGGLLALLFLALTPPFYGHAFFNSKDTPFAGTYALAVAAILACDAWPRVAWGRVLGAGVLVGLAAAVRVGGIVLCGFALVLWLGVLVLRSGRSGGPGLPAGRDLLRLLGAWAAAVAAGWAAMTAFWPWAMLDPLRNPFRAARRFSSFWETALVFYDGRLVSADQVSRFYLPNWFALTLPELFLVAGLMGLVALGLLWRARPLPPETRLRLLQAGWLAGIPLLLVTGVVVRRMPLYDGLRHFLFLFPLLAALAGVCAAAFFRSALPRGARLAGGGVLLAACLVTLVDMVRLHPYQSVYFNRLWAGGMKAGVDRYEGDYFCLSYKEGCEWLRRRYEGASCREPIRVAGQSVQEQTDLYLRRTEEGRQLFRSVPVATGNPHYVLTTTRFLDHLKTPGKLVFTAEREGAKLLYLFELHAPECGAR